MRIEVASRELRNSTADLLRRVEEGDEIVITVRGRPAAALVRIADHRRRWLPRRELVQRLGIAQADPGLRGDLTVLAGETTDDLGPVG